MDEIKIIQETKIRPFPVPDFVYVVTEPGLKQDGMRPAPTIKLSDLSMDALDFLCRKFRQDVMMKAKKTLDGNSPLIGYDTPGSF